MSPTTAKTLMTGGGILIGGAAIFLPQAIPALAPFSGFLLWLSGALKGGALIHTPGDLAKARDATDALAKALEGEK